MRAGKNEGTRADLIGAGDVVAMHSLANAVFVASAPSILVPRLELQHLVLLVPAPNSGVCVNVCVFVCQNSV